MSKDKNKNEVFFQRVIKKSSEVKTNEKKCNSESKPKDGTQPIIRSRDDNSNKN